MSTSNEKTILLLNARERQALHRALELVDLDRRRFAMSVALGVFGLVCAVGLSAVAAWLIARASQTPEVVALGVAPVAVRFFGVSRPIARYCERLVSHDVALRGMTSLRTRLYEILSVSRTDTVAGLRRGDVLARVGSDVDAVGDLLVRSYLPMWVAGCLGIATTVLVAVIHPASALVLALGLLLSGLGGPLATMQAARRAELARQEESKEVSALALTVLDGGSELAVADSLDGVMGALAGAEARLARSRDLAARPAAWAAILDQAGMAIAVVGSIILGVPAVTNGSLAPVMLAVTVLVPLAAFEANAALGPATVQLVRSAGAAQRVVELVESAEDSAARVPQTHSLAQPASNGPVLRARGLAVGWPAGPAVAEGIDLDLHPGRRLAIVGPSGIGKTTLLLTLAGLLEPKAGSLLLDDGEPWGAAREEVSNRVVMTAEDAHIFSTTVLENLRVANGTLSPQEARALLERAGLGPWLAALPKGLDTVLGADARDVSGGERRRLLLARALASPASLLLLDEPAEHLDPATADALVTDLLNAGTTEAGADSQLRGILLVTHRLSALNAADEVLILGHNTSEPASPARVLDRGTHAELQQRSENYRWSLTQEDKNRE
ncbi:Probable multidrug resistance ABC transporter ATP-binding/permease protein YheH [Actinomyces bovis]|uniref:Probable multidrug resistance ABC transporter ATP-binding/permease protein YheH n=1 Tax=Actinomyces bovis TaxID=1658 RepID=A0ABY1VKN3_9ACTO|nr:thiol reductant ABC exporter subunit CydC [Actinomyces bovis]SPT52580.1 Probable multidrug resistance ABC transporter ATP-binding/permease protein YheH [Actinomyces bovis]VEG54373.1 Probable multidrug resistance ABC transporter ATP-binding/permease protein YheH [Actinomyces israelii]